MHDRLLLHHLHSNGRKEVDSWPPQEGVSTQNNFRILPPVHILRLTVMSNRFIAASFVGSVDSGQGIRQSPVLPVDSRRWSAPSGMFEISNVVSDGLGAAHVQSRLTPFLGLM